MPDNDFSTPRGTESPGSQSEGFKVTAGGRMGYEERGEQGGREEGSGPGHGTHDGVTSSTP